MKSRFRRPLMAFREFLRLEVASGLVLMLATVVAIVVANSPLGAGYEALLHTELGLFDLTMSALHWVNDGLMAVFFLLVGLEIKREMLVGELSSLKRIALPASAAAGGMVVPALIYAAINAGAPESETLRGWAIPAATDIAFALGTLALLGARVPPSLKVALAALAILDDLGAIAIIAIFYIADLSELALGLAGVCLVVLAAMNFMGVRRLAPYLAVGAVLWACVLSSGVHATLAGVALAFAIPLKVDNLGATERSPLHRLEHALHPWVAYLIVPVFALANAGVSFAEVNLPTMLEPVPIGIACGLFFGKQIGVAGAAFLAIATGLATRPAGASALQLYGIAILCGIGFTMSLFIGSLAFSSDLLITETKLGVFAGSILSGLVGYALLRFAAAPPSR
jgi:Na+:H+ antiporter, NhaA family